MLKSAFVPNLDGALPNARRLNYELSEVISVNST